MDITTPLWRLYRHHFIHDLHLNEFMNNLQLTFNNEEFAFTHKMQMYDKDTELVTNKYIFMGATLTDPEFDKEFKRAFINRYANRQIGSQTSDRFRQIIVSIFLTQKRDLDYFYENYKDMVGKGQTTGSTSQGRSVTKSLPQDETHFDLRDYDFKNASVASGALSEQNGNSTAPDIDALLKIGGFLDKKIAEYDEKGFLQVL